MNQNQPQQPQQTGMGGGMNPATPPIIPPKKGGSMGPTMGVIIIIILLILGGLYFWGKELMDQQAPVPEGDQTTQMLEQQGTSDDPNAIEADLMATPTEAFDDGLGDFEAELNSL